MENMILSLCILKEHMGERGQTCLIIPWKRRTEFVSRTHLKDPHGQKRSTLWMHRKRHPRFVGKLECGFSYTLCFPPRDVTFCGAFPPMGIFEMGSSIKYKMIQSFWFTIFSGRKGEALVEVPKSLKTKSWFSVQSFLGRFHLENFVKRYASYASFCHLQNKWYE